MLQRGAVFCNVLQIGSTMELLKDVRRTRAHWKRMKSLATVLLIFVTCLAVAGTMALIDQAQAVLAVPTSIGNSR